jgi:biopolymer transport protein TolR
MQTRARSSRRAPMAEINVTPFVDVMLVLLIIFMVTAPLLATGVPVELPEARADALPQEREQIDIAIRSDGALFFDGEQIEPEQLSTRLDGFGGGDGGPAVTLRADRSLPYGQVMTVMAELQRAGLTSIALVTDSSTNAP